MNGLFYTILFLKKLNYVAFYLCEALHLTVFLCVLEPQ